MRSQRTIPTRVKPSLVFHRVLQPHAMLRSATRAVADVPAAGTSVPSPVEAALLLSVSANGMHPSLGWESMGRTASLQ